MHGMHEAFAHKSRASDVNVCYHEVQARCEIVVPFHTEPGVNILAARTTVPFDDKINICNITSETLL